MTGHELQALRRFLFFTPAEAARRIAVDDQRPEGVEERTWNRWEAGQRPVPENIADTVRELVGWRNGELARLRDQLRRTLRDSPAMGVTWPAEPYDWPAQMILWRPYQSAVAQLLAEAPGQVQLGAGQMGSLPTV